MVASTEFSPSGFIARARSILLKPAETWDAIAEEPATVAGLFTSYAVVLAAIPAVAALSAGRSSAFR
jgi:hypothetical protein